MLCCISISRLYSQCAGSDSSVTVCDKDNDVSTRTYALFDKLGGSPSNGGTWQTSDPANFFALDQSTGVVDLWRINNFGEHQFTYTNPICNESATVTIRLGGYPGENNIDGSANACGDDPNVNLHSFLGSEIDGKVQDFNGLWEEDPSTFTGQLEDNIFDARAAGPGIYEFTYTVDMVDSCPSRQSRVILEVHPAANPGLATSFVICTNDDFSAFTNFDLNNQLVGEDPNGTWSESRTNQLSDLNDSVIDLEEINANFGYGTYSFVYTVFPSHPVCEEMSAIVNIDILPVIDGTMTASNFCSGEDYSINLSYDDTILFDGSFEIEYLINGNPGIASAVLANGSGNFMVDPGLVPLNTNVTLAITRLIGVTPLRDVCPTVIVPNTTFLVSEAQASANNGCQGTPTTVTLTNILDTSSSPANGDFDLNYTLTGPSVTNSNFGLTNITFNNGNASFEIEAANLDEGGDYNIVVSITNALPLSCNLESSFVVTPTPSAIDLDLQIDDSCDATVIDVLVDAPILGDGTYTITYDVTELTTNTVLTTNTINFNGGSANYQIDVASLPKGNYTARVLSTQTDSTPCRTVFDFELTENFARGGIPGLPTAEPIQEFCLSDFNMVSPSLADIEVSADGLLLFYATAGDMDILPLSTALIDGEDYYVSNTDPDNNCEGSDRIAITILISDPAPPNVSDSNPRFCSTENPTLNDIELNVPENHIVVWFDAPVAGNLLDGTTPLMDNTSYFAATKNPSSCIGTMRMEIVPSIISPNIPSFQSDSFMACGLDTPTIFNLRELENQNDNNVFWYDDIDSTDPLPDETVLEERIYYAEGYDTTFDCRSLERIAVTVTLSDCVPEEYDFFVPDGFSPNGDGRNDTFFIPNIEVIFPDFTLEIVNRYGTTLFRGDARNPAWGGQNGSTLAPSGVYFYIIEFNKEGFEPKQGRLYLNN